MSERPRTSTGGGVLGRDGGGRAPRVLAVAVVIAVALMVVGMAVELRQRSGSRAWPGYTTTGTDLSAPLPVPEPMPAPPGADDPPPVVPAPGDGPVGTGDSVLFRGGPATGQWAQLGTVAEVTHPRADERAADSYRMFWQDHDLPDALWDRLVREVGEELVTLGRPVSEPAFGVSERSHRLAAWGGRQYGTEHTGGRGIVAQFDAVASDDGQPVWSRWAFLVDPVSGEVLARMPRASVTEQEAATVDDATAALSSAVGAWLAEVTEGDAEGDSGG